MPWKRARSARVVRAGSAEIPRLGSRPALRREWRPAFQFVKKTAPKNKTHSTIEEGHSPSQKNRVINVGRGTRRGRGRGCGGCAAKAAAGSINHFLRLCRKEPLNAGISEICRERGKSAFQTPRLPGVGGRGAAKEAAAAS